MKILPYVNRASLVPPGFQYPFGVDRAARRGATGDSRALPKEGPSLESPNVSPINQGRYSGILPCLRGGVRSDLPCNIASERMITLRVSAGSITSSKMPRDAA